MTTHAPRSLVFVTYLDTPQEAARAPALRQAVRSRALRSRHEAARLSSSGQIPTPKSHEDHGDQRSHMHRFRLGSNSASAKDRKSTSLERDLEEETAEEEIDGAVTRRESPPRAKLLQQPPQSSFLMSLGPHVGQLMNYCKSGSPVDGWYQWFISNPAIAQASLAFISLNRDLDGGNGISAITLQHKHAAIKLAHDMLAKRMMDTFEVLVGIVAILLTVEVRQTISPLDRFHIDE
ncbi:hypothetical protein LTS10_011228 [Elasticomyces elasticus]|nr:hypothetical protein LTS10_011228 [Elasticomyces elasticus]